MQETECGEELLFLWPSVASVPVLAISAVVTFASLSAVALMRGCHRREPWTTQLGLAESVLRKHVP